MEKYITPAVAFIIGVALVVVPATAYLTKDVPEPAVGGFGDTFLSIQLATDPDNGECLTTDGTDNAWSSDCGSGGGGGGLATTTTWTAGNIVRVVDDGTVDSLATSSLGLPTFADLTSYLTNITGLITAGSNVTITGSGTSGDPYEIAASGGGGGGGLATTTPWNLNELAVVAGSSTVRSVATSTLSEDITGLQFDGNPWIIGTGRILSLTSGYVIPLSASTTEWHNFHTTPSGRITAGTGIDWSGNTLDVTVVDTNTTYTAGDALTLTGTDFDFDGGASPGGDLGGTWASPSVDDDSHAHTGTTLSGIDISSDTNLTAGDALTLTGDDIDFDGGATPGGVLGGTWASPTLDDNYLLNSGDSGTGNYSFSGTFSAATTTISGLFSATVISSSSLGNTVNSLTAKTTPADNDMFALMDSAASNILKKFSWANLKTAIGAFLTALPGLTDGDVLTASSTATYGVVWTAPSSGGGSGEKMKAYHSTTQAGANTPTKMSFDTESFDTGSDFASNTYTVPTTGYYTVSFRFVVASGATSGQTWTAYVYINGSPVSYAGIYTEDTGDTPSAQITETYSLTAGDTIEIYRSGTDPNYTVQGGTEGSVFEVIQLP